MGQKHSQLNELDFCRLSEETNFSKDEVKKWYAGFMKDCPTGEMQRTEFVKVYSEMFPNGDASNFSNYIFNVSDHDGNGSVSFDEFIKVQVLFKT